MNYFKKLWLRFYIRIKRSGTRNDKVHISAFETEVLKICRILIRHESSTLLVCPTTGRSFITYDPMKIKIIIEDNKIVISNHQYYYEVSISKSGTDNIMRVFNGNVKGRRDLLEADIKTNAKTTLNLIFKTSLQTL